MALTRDFKQTFKARVDRDAAFRAALLAETMVLFLTGDVSTGKSLLRDYINATIGFAALADQRGDAGDDSLRWHRAREYRLWISVCDAGGN